jgi:hypothetical protein
VRSTRTVIGARRSAGPPDQTVGSEAVERIPEHRRGPGLLLHPGLARMPRRRPALPGHRLDVCHRHPVSSRPRSRRRPFWALPRAAKRPKEPTRCVSVDVIAAASRRSAPSGVRITLEERPGPFNWVFHLIGESPRHLSTACPRVGTTQTHPQDASMTRRKRRTVSARLGHPHGWPINAGFAGDSLPLARRSRQAPAWRGPVCIRTR